MRNPLLDEYRAKTSELRCEAIWDDSRCEHVREHKGYHFWESADGTRFAEWSPREVGSPTSPTMKQYLIDLAMGGAVGILIVVILYLLSGCTGTTHNVGGYEYPGPQTTARLLAHGGWGREYYLPPSPSLCPPYGDGGASILFPDSGPTR